MKNNYAKPPKPNPAYAGKSAKPATYPDMTDPKQRAVVKKSKK